MSSDMTNGVTNRVSIDKPRERRSDPGGANGVTNRVSIDRPRQRLNDPGGANGVTNRVSIDKPRERLSDPAGANGVTNRVSIDKPRKRLWARGVTKISDEELLSILLGTGVRDHPVLAVASELVKASGNVAALSRASPRELSLVTGVGTARAARIAAAFELGRRAVEGEHQRETLARPEDVYRLVSPRVAGLPQELFFVLGVDIRNGLLDVVEVARGSVHGVEVHPREVFRPLVRMAAAGAVLAHNHPTGDATPSTEDIELTRRLRAVGDMLGIPIIDHVVVGDGQYRSIAELMGTVL